MRKRSLTHLAGILLSALAILSPGATLEAAGPQAPSWEVVSVKDTDIHDSTDAGSPVIEVSTTEGKVQISVDRPCEISVYTILGQLVTKRRVQPGVLRLTLGNRGIYILKAGAATRRINL